MQIQGSSFIPYQRKDGKMYLFLQKRDKKAPTYPGYFGVFGGRLELNETPEEGMHRELREELEYSPRSYQYFGVYECEEKKTWVYGEEVGDDFEGSITIHEGECARWFLEDEIEKEKIRDFTRIVLKDVYHQLTTTPLKKD